MKLEYYPVPDDLVKKASHLESDYDFRYQWFGVKGRVYRMIRTLKIDGHHLFEDDHIKFVEYVCDDCFYWYAKVVRNNKHYIIPIMTYFDSVKLEEHLIGDADRWNI